METEYKIRDYQKVIVKTLYENLIDSMASLEETFATNNLKTMKKYLKERIIVGDDLLNVKVDINAIATGLKLLKDLKIPLDLRRADIENKANMYSNLIN